MSLKSILGIRSRKKALDMMDKLTEPGCIDYTLDPKTKKPTYQVNLLFITLSSQTMEDGLHLFVCTKVLEAQCF